MGALASRAAATCGDIGGVVVRSRIDRGRGRALLLLLLLVLAGATPARLDWRPTASSSSSRR